MAYLLDANVFIDAKNRYYGLDFCPVFGEVMLSKHRSYRQAHAGAGIREIRVLIAHRNRLLRLCKLAFSRKDASFYLFPYANQGQYYYGGRSLPEKQLQDSFDFTTQFSGDRIPKLSIHESGQVHVLVGQERAGPLSIPPLPTLKGQHIATVVPDAFEALPRFHGSPEVQGPEIDHVIPAAEAAENGRLAIYVNGGEPKFDATGCRLTIELKRPTLPRPVYVGIKPIGQIPLGDGRFEGVSVIAGWDPTAQPDAEAKYLYVRGK